MVVSLILVLKQAQRSPNSGDPDFQALRIIEQNGEEREELLHVVVKAFDNVLENSIEDVNADFAMRGCGGCACLLEERKEGWPLAGRNLNRCNSRNDARC